MDEFNLTDWADEAPPVGTDLEPPKPTLSVTSVKILNYCEQVFWESGLLPTVEAVAEELSLQPTTCRKAFADEVFQQQLATRGIDGSALAAYTKGGLSAVIKETKALSAKQVIVANMMLNLHDKRSEREKLQIVGVSSQQYHAWLRQPQFVEFMRKRGEAIFQSSDFKAYKSLVRNVEAGDNKSLELFFRMRGIYNPTVNININIESVLTQVIEIISLHVKDPVVLNAIANDIDRVIDVAEEVA